MAGFKTLRDICTDFEQDLRRTSSELFSVKIHEPFEEVIAKKMKHLTMLTSKLRLLQAKTIACTPQITDMSKSEQSTLESYTEAASTKIIEKQVVKCVTQSHFVKKIVTTPNSVLDPEFIERKEKIIDTLKKFKKEEEILQYLKTTLTQKELELEQARLKWNDTLTKLKASKHVARDSGDIAGPLYRKLKGLVDKMELIRWLISKLVTSRTLEYDWLSDPHMRLKALATARQAQCIEHYTKNM